LFILLLSARSYVFAGAAVRALNEGVVYSFKLYNIKELKHLPSLYLPAECESLFFLVTFFCFSTPQLPSLRELWHKGKFSRKMLLNAYLQQQGITRIFV